MMSDNPWSPDTNPEFVEVTADDMVGQPDVVADQTPYADEEDDV